jgi:hypothetical protein
MSAASEFKQAAQTAKIYEVTGKSGAVYIFFWFADHSVCAARRLPAGNAKASARLEFRDTKTCLDDCGMAAFEGTTYQKGRELLKRLES